MTLFVSVACRPRPPSDLPERSTIEYEGKQFVYPDVCEEKR